MDGQENWALQSGHEKKKMDGLISIIVPVFNTAPYLVRCIESVLKQTYKFLELVLVDDGSTDESGFICESYEKQDQRVKVFHQKNAGVCAARNLGIKKMSGNFFMFLDSDDSLEINALEICHKRIVRDNSDVVIFGRREIKNSQIINSEVYGNEVLVDSIDVVRKILADRHIYGGGYPNKMWRTATFTENDQMIPLFNQNLFYVEDMEWVIRMILKVKKISLLDGIFYNYYLRDDSVSRKASAQESLLIGYHDAMKQMVNDLVDYPDIWQWFRGIYFSELINSTLDAVMKRQTVVVKVLIQRIYQEKQDIMKHSSVTQKCKRRCSVLLIAHFFRII